MKNLVLASLLAAGASQVAGCVFESNSNPPEAAHIVAGWTFRSVASGAVTGCPAGYETAVVHSQPVDANGNNNGPEITDFFNCSAGSGQTDPLPAQQILTWVSIVHADNASPPHILGSYADSLAQYVDITTVDQATANDIFVDGGFFQVAWDLRAHSNGAPVTCAQASASGVGITATLVGPGTLVDYTFPHCTDLEGISKGVPAGNYDLTVDAVNSANASLGMSAQIHTSVAYPNKVTNLGTVQIPIDAL